MLNRKKPYLAVMIIIVYLHECLEAPIMEVRDVIFTVGVIPVKASNVDALTPLLKCLIPV